MVSIKIKEMKKLYYFITFIIIGLSSCIKEEIEQPTFDVSTTSTTYKVGDTVRFNFK